jgi:hypothetical protein
MDWGSQSEDENNISIEEGVPKGFGRMAEGLTKFMSPQGKYCPIFTVEEAMVILPAFYGRGG